LATSASLNNPQGLAFDTVGNMYIGDQSNVVRKITYSSQIITTIAGTLNQYILSVCIICLYVLGTGVAGSSGDGSAATSAKLNVPRGVAVDTNGNVYVADYSNNCVRKISKSGVITKFAGIFNSKFVLSKPSRHLLL